MPRASDNHRHFRQPPSTDVRVWRYFNVPRALELLRSRTLWMSRSDRLRDPCEGSRPAGDARIYAAAEQAILAEGSASYLPAIRGTWKHFDASLKTRMFISCWQMSEHQDMGMWERYCKPKEAGIAIQTTYLHLDAAVPVVVGGNDPLMLGLVSYGDFESPNFTSDPGDRYSTFLLKKILYRNEHEVRLVCEVSRGDSTGFAIPINVEMLVEQLVFSPYARPALVKGVERAIRDMGYRFPISHSTAFQISTVY